MKLLMTGSEGLIGRAVKAALMRLGFAVTGCDLRSSVASEKFDFRNVRKLRVALSDCDGVLHFGSLSRVIWGEQYPDLCRSINIEGMNTLMTAVAESRHKIWVIYASSREIYGTPPTLPCAAGTPPNPENLYAETKYAGEKMMQNMRCNGFCATIVRFSNVFGSVNDYHDRVVPAFAKASASNGILHVRGADSILDFTPLGDAVSAVVRVVEKVASGVCDLPPIDIVTGRGTSLMELAHMALSHGGGDIVVEERQGFYPARFQGDPRVAKECLGWIAQESIEHAVGRLVEDFKKLKGVERANFENHSWVSAAL